MKSQRVVLLPAIVSVVLLFTTYLSADSHVRMVRLSFVQGSVLIDHGTGQGFEPAIMNMPVDASTRIRTGDDGLAEIEFENGSTLRLTGDTSVLFQPLSLTDKGIRLSGMSVSEGTVYIHLKKEKHDKFFLTVRDLHMELLKNAHLRVSADSTQILVAVFQGELSDPQTGVLIKKNQSFRIDTTTDQITDVAQGIDPYFTDAWDQERDKYQKNPKKYPGLATGSLAFAAVTLPTYDGCYSPLAGIFGGWDFSCFSNQIYLYPTAPVITPNRHPVRPPLPPTKGHDDQVVTLPNTVVKLPTNVALQRPERPARNGGSNGAGGGATVASTQASSATVAASGAHWVPLPANSGRGPANSGNVARSFSPMKGASGGGNSGTRSSGASSSSTRSSSRPASGSSSMRSSGSSSSSSHTSSSSSTSTHK